jgi:hypothetical protein
LPGNQPTGIRQSTSGKKTTEAPDICFLVEIASKTKKKDRNFDPTISYLYIAVNSYEFLSAEAHHVSNEKITRDLQRDPAQDCPVPQLGYNQG